VIDHESKLEKRIALGKKLGLNVGSPLDTTMLVDGSTIEVRDDLGLLLDSTLYAKSKCNQCYGRGYLVTQKPLSADEVGKMQSAGDARYICTHQKRGPGHVLRNVSVETARCSCAVTQYTKAVTRFQEALLKEGLAVRSLQRSGHLELV